MTGDRGELFGKGLSNVEMGCMDFVVEGDRLVGGRGVVFARKGFK